MSTTIDPGLDQKSLDWGTKESFRTCERGVGVSHENRGLLICYRPANSRRKGSSDVFRSPRASPDDHAEKTKMSSVCLSVCRLGCHAFRVQIYTQPADRNRYVTPRYVGDSSTVIMNIYRIKIDETVYFIRQSHHAP